MDNPEKLATQCTQDEETQNLTQHVLDTTMRKQKHNNINKDNAPSTNNWR